MLPDFAGVVRSSLACAHHSHDGWQRQPDRPDAIVMTGHCQHTSDGFAIAAGHACPSCGARVDNDVCREEGKKEPEVRPSDIRTDAMTLA
jgi:hypothetical protein